jgi:hypothetical protein
MFRKALWPSDGCVDAIIHTSTTQCGMTDFSDGTIDESIIARWNTRASLQPATPTAGGVTHSCEPIDREAAAAMYGRPATASDTVAGEAQTSLAEQIEACRTITARDRLIDANLPLILAALRSHVEAARALHSAGNASATDTIGRLRKQAADVIDWHGQTMKEWDKIRATVEAHKGSDLPRLMFEGLVESLAELMSEGADEIENQIRNVRHWREECGKLHAKLAQTPDVAQCGRDPLGFMTVDEWPKEIDERVLIYVVHENAQYEADEAIRKAKWEGWHVGYWTDFNTGGWVWHGMLGKITHVAPLLPPPCPISSPLREPPHD